MVNFETLITVKYDLNTNEVYGVRSFGAPYSPSKALAEGQEITQEELTRITENKKHTA